MMVGCKRELSIDIETYSDVDLLKCGVYKYVDSPEFEILLFGYAFDDEPVSVIDLASFEDLPDEVFYALTDPYVLKTSYNANFERVCIERHFGFRMVPEQWQCTAVHASYLGLPSGLDKVAQALGLDAQKDSKGKALIRYFSVPCKPTKTNGGRTRNFPTDDIERWSLYKEYCRQDVVVEREISKQLSAFPIPQSEWDMWYLDQYINDRGVRLESDLVEGAIELSEIHTKILTERLTELTNLRNPNSVAQLKSWLMEHGLEVESLSKDSIPMLIEATQDDDVVEVLKLRQEASKTSVKKYQAMQRAMCSDGKVRGLLQFYGANRTGRWAGRLVQVQNLPRNYMTDLEDARKLVMGRDYEMLQMLYGDVPDVLSQLVRTAFVPEKGERFVVADFSAIEARVIAWLANEKWRLDVFDSHGKIYEASAAAMFGIPIDEVDGGMRQKGKVAELALGYQGGPGALIAMGALDMGLAEEELKPLVVAWRKANSNIVKLWYDIQNAAFKAAQSGDLIKFKGLAFRRRSSWLFCKLPSGRILSYYEPKIQEGKFGDKLTYMGVNDRKQWARLDTYGGKLVENIVQAIARDCLAESMKRLEAEGYKVRMHIHDEVVISCKGEELDKICEIMGRPIEWAPGLNLTADAYYTDFYKKD